MGCSKRNLVSLFFCALCLETSVKADRSDAFIGYSEEGRREKLPKCVDKEAGCGTWEKDRQCLLNPYFMREACPIACRAWTSFCTSTMHTTAPWDGHATDVGTRLYATMYPGVATDTHFTHWRKDPSMGEFDVPGQSVRGDPWLWLGSIGMGTYLGHEDMVTDHHVASAVILSVQSGFNVIDSAPNYRNGRGELAIAQGLTMLRDNVKLGFRRDMLFVSTKAGYCTTSLLAQLLNRKLIKDTDVVDGHCIHPECLKASIKGSLERLNMRTVDLLYLHNVAEAQAAKVGKEELKKRLEAAFRVLEELRKTNKIRSYGLATWDSFRVGPNAPTFLNLQEVVHIAESVGGRNHGFRYIQLPINLEMTEAWREHNQMVTDRYDGRPAEMLPILRAAGRLGVGVFASGPLAEGGLESNTRIMATLESMPELDAVQGGPMVKALQVVRSTPFLLSAIVGHKMPGHVQKNTELARKPMLTNDEFAHVQIVLAGGNEHSLSSISR